MTDCDEKYLEFIGLEGELDDFARSQHQYIIWCNGYEAGQHNKFIGEYLDRKVDKLETQIEKMKCCSNCKHNSKFTDNAEFCWNCEIQFSKIGEEIIKDEWELAE